MLWQLFVGLSVHLLDGYHDQLAIPEYVLKPHTRNTRPPLPPPPPPRLSSPAVQRGFETDRHLLLNALLEGGQYQFAAELAEKYADFGVLVSLCEGVGDRGKLREYMATFKEQVMSSCVTVCVYMCVLVHHCIGICRISVQAILGQRCVKKKRSL